MTNYKLKINSRDLSVNVYALILCNPICSISSKELKDYLQHSFK